MRVLTLFVLMAVSASCLAEKQPFERYQPIIDRQVFGPLPPGFDPTKLPSEVQKSSSAGKELTQEQEKLQSAVHFSVIDVRPSGDVVVGFTDNSDPKSPRNYFLKVGETRDGWTVREADPETAEMTVEKDGIEVSLSLGGNSAKGTGTTSRANPAGAGAAAPSLLGGRGSSLSSRRLLKRQALADKRAQEAAAAAEKEAQRAREAEAEKAQREAERAEQRQQLQAIQEELKRVREAKAAAEERPKEENGEEN